MPLSASGRAEWSSSTTSPEQSSAQPRLENAGCDWTSRGRLTVDGGVVVRLCEDHNFSNDFNQTQGSRLADRLKPEEDTAKHRITQLEASCPGGQLPEGEAMCAAGCPSSNATSMSIRVQDLAGVQAGLFCSPLAPVCLLPGRHGTSIEVCYNQSHSWVTLPVTSKRSTFCMHCPALETKLLPRGYKGAGCTECGSGYAMADTSVLT